MNRPTRPLPATARARLPSTARPPRRQALGDAPLGGLSVDEFLRHTWQRRPLLVRAALPDIKPPCDVEALLALAEEDAVQSRLVTSFGGRWRLEHGPFDREALPPLSRRRWTLLVQGVNLHDDRAHALMSRFRFLPDARIDDLMISLASDQGGVGPHLDSYDVFLVQLWGRRRWRIAPPGSDQLRPGLPLKILERFAPTESWLLEPGDMLYLPPGWAHDGVAEGPCMTGSIGFRAPSRHEFLREFLADSSDSLAGADPRYSDRGRLQPARPAAIPEDLHQQLFDWAKTWRPSDAAINDFIGRFMTEPAANVFFEGPERLPFKRFVAAMSRYGVRLDRRTRLLYRGNRFHINGETLASQPQPTSAQLLRELADRRQLDAASALLAIADASLVETLHAWAEAGWLHAEPPARGSWNTGTE